MSASALMHDVPARIDHLLKWLQEVRDQRIRQEISSPL
jgi:hypothetical protein